MKVIGRVRLAAGEVAFYDETSRVHLTVTSPEADIYDFTNTSAIKRAIKFRRLVLMSGTLSKDNEIKQVITKTEINKEVFTKPVIEEAAPPIIEEIIEAAPEEVVEIKTEEAAEVKEEIIEKPKTKKSGKSKKSTKTSKAESK